MRRISRGLGFIVLLVLGLVPGLAKGEASGQAGLVALVQHQGASTADRSFSDRLVSTMVRRTIGERYRAVAILNEERAERYAFFKSLEQMVRAGLQVDVLLLGSKSAQATRGAIEFVDGVVDATALDRELGRIMRHARSGGAIRLVFAAVGGESSGVWRRTGQARAVLSYSEEQELAPYYLGRFLKRWGEGESVTAAADQAAAFSSDLIGRLNPFVYERGVVLPAPRFEGTDITVSGERVADSIEPRAVLWPAEQPNPQYFSHRSLEEGLIAVVGRVLSPRFLPEPSRVPDFMTLLAQLGDPVFIAVQELFPGRNENEIALPGGEVKVIFGKIIPDLDKYLQGIVDHIDSIVITRKDGRLIFDAWLTDADVKIELRKQAVAKLGQPYGVALGRHLHCEVFMRRDSVTLDQVRGVSVLLKLPVVPDGVSPTKVRLDTSTETLTINALAVKGWVEVVGKADVRARKFTGVDWVGTMMGNLPLILSLMFFGVV